MLDALRPPLATDREPSRLSRREFAPQVSLSVLIDVLRRRLPVLLACVAIVLALGTAYAFLTPKKYLASATLLIDSRLAQLSQTEASAAIVDQAAVESQIELLRSEKIVTSVVAKLHLLDDPEFTGPSSSDEQASAEVALRHAVAVMSGNLWVSRVGRSYLVSVAYSSPEAAKAAEIANEVAAAYIADQINAKIQAAKDQNAWLEAQVSERRSRAAETIRTVQEFKAAHDVTPLRDPDIQATIDRLASEASRGRADTVSARGALDQIVDARAGLVQPTGAPPDEVRLRGLGDAALDDLLTRHAAMLIQDGARTPTGPQRPDFLGQLDARLAVLEAQRRDAWTAAITRQRSADDALADMRLRDTRGRLADERLRELETAAATARSLYESYLNQLTRAAQQQPVPASDTRIVSPATVPLYPSTPKKKLTVVLAGFTGIVLGGVAIFAVESLDTVIRTRDGLVAASGLPCIGVVPWTRRRRQRRGQSALERLQGALPRLAAAGAQSRGADTLRRLQLAARSDSVQMGGCVLGITSAVAGAGTTTIAVNLALAAREGGTRVLLIDANLRRPVLSLNTRPDDPASPPGPPSGDAMVHLDDRFDVLPVSADGAIEGAELPDLRRLEEAISNARQHYGLIIVDLPAVLPLAEIRPAISRLDLTILVVRWGVTTSVHVQRALDHLSDTDLLFGTILNGAKIRAMHRFEGRAHGSFADETRA